MRGWQIWLGVVAGLVVGPGVSRGELTLTPPGDPNRNWSAALLTTAGYNDNINTTPSVASSNRQESATIVVEPQATLRLPGARTSGQLRYAYSAVYYNERNGSKPDESHLVDTSLTHNLTPRLTLSLSDALRRGIEPDLVEQQISGTPLITRRRGGYYYNTLNGGVNLALTERLSLSLNQSWTRWWFDDPAQSETNDRDEYGTLFSTSYALTPRTFVGGSYRFSLTSFSEASATNELRDSTSHAMYATMVHRFSPLVVGQINAGIQLAGFTGQTDLGPYVNLGGSYNFSARSTLGAGFSYNIQLTEVAAYRSSEQATTYLSLNHRLTRRIGTALSFAYVLGTYQNLNPLYRNPDDITQKTSVAEDSWRVSATVTYDFTRWAALYLNYTYNEVSSGLDNPITNTFRSFDRNQLNAGLRLTY
ncbi:MAG: hypothetical protein PCFJNLEI_00437 [Verrucomicrobiae bacterium]|nr:hypothetical protein [Verrucomicrobiae bacterium]